MNPQTVSASWAAGEIAKREAAIAELQARLDELRQSFLLNNPPQDEGDNPDAAPAAESE